MSSELRKKRARWLRLSSTDAESVLWRHLRNSQLANAKFKRQQPHGPYILDFYCHEHHLVIEVDGGQHYEAEELVRDAARTRYLEAHGLRVLRFSNLEVLKETQAVLNEVFRQIEAGRAQESSAERLS